MWKCIFAWTNRLVHTSVHTSVTHKRTFARAWQANGTPSLSMRGGRSHHCRHLEWHNLEAHVNEDNTISVKDITNDSKESLGIGYCGFACNV